jgi:hypothetical protein
MYIYTLLLGMAYIMTPQKSDLSFWNILYKATTSAQFYKNG